MNKIVYEVLDRIEEANFEAYIVGGYVRDIIMGIPTVDVDICTSALPKDIKQIFNINEESNLYGSINFNRNNYNFDITTFRKEYNYEKRRPTKVQFIKDLKDDVLRRDFTINSLCMDKNDNLIDYLNGKDDITNKKIRLIGDNIRLKEDPLRILRAIRFATVYDFEIDDKLNDGIVMYKEYINELSITRIKNEIDKILVSKNFKKGLNLLKKYNILNMLGINVHNNIKYVADLSGMYSQLNIENEKYPFTKEEKNNMKEIKKIVSKKAINNQILYNYGLYISSIAAKILGYKQDEIVDMYNKLPIKSVKDLDITFLEIKDVVITNDCKEIKIIQDIIIDGILSGKLKNNKNEIIKFIRQGMS